MDKKTFREWREISGYTAKHVASVLEMTPQTLCRKEKGAVDFTRLQQKVLCSLYGIDISQVKEV